MEASKRLPCTGRPTTSKGKKGADEGGRRNAAGREKLNREEGVRGRSTVVEKRNIFFTVNRQRSRSDTIEPAQADPEDEKRKGGGSRKKGAERKGARGKQMKLAQEAIIT